MSIYIYWYFSFFHQHYFHILNYISHLRSWIMEANCRGAQYKVVWNLSRGNLVKQCTHKIKIWKDQMLTSYLICRWVFFHFKYKTKQNTKIKVCVMKYNNLKCSKRKTIWTTIFEYTHVDLLQNSHPKWKFHYNSRAEGIGICETKYDKC